MPSTRDDWKMLEQTAASRLLSAQPREAHPAPHRPTALLVTAVLGDPCLTFKGGWTNIVSIKNKQDFADMHGYRLYWTNEHLDSELFGAMNKIQVLRYLAYRYRDDPHIEWFWWLDQGVWGQLPSANVDHHHLHLQTHCLPI